MAAELNVEHVLKGNFGGRPLTIHFLWPDEGIGYKIIVSGTFGIFFLRGGDDAYEVADSYHAYVPAVPGFPAVGGSCLEQVVAGLADVFQARGSAIPDRWIRWDAVNALGTVKEPSATAALEAAARDEDLLVRVWAIRALIARDYLPALKLAGKVRVVGPVPGTENLTASLGATISGVKDPKAVPLLLPLLSSTDVNVRRGAAGALANIPDLRALGPLGEALYDPDHDVRYYAVVGLGKITGQNQWTPSIATFNRNEKKLLEHWRGWARAHGYAPTRTTP